MPTVITYNVNQEAGSKAVCFDNMEDTMPN